MGFTVGVAFVSVNVLKKLPQFLQTVFHKVVTSFMTEFSGQKLFALFNQWGMKWTIPALQIANSR